MLTLDRARRVVVLSPHTDDGEFGCGATIARLLDEGADVYNVAFSYCEESVPEGFPKDALRNEAADAAAVLGIAPDRLILLNFPVRKFPQFRQEILEEMVRIRREIQPDLVILPSTNDLHQDHGTIASEGWRAFKSTSLLGYEVAWNNLTFTAHLFSRVTTEHVDRKIAAMNAYKSQAFRSYAKDSFIRSLAEVRGTQVGQPLAEAFEVIRWIL